MTGPSTNYGDIPEVNAIIHDGTERLLYEVTFTDEGYLVKSPFNPITDRLTLSVTADLNICEIAIFGRNSSDSKLLLCSKKNRNEAYHHWSALKIYFEWFYAFKKGFGK